MFILLWWVLKSKYEKKKLIFFTIVFYLLSPLFLIFEAISSEDKILSPEKIIEANFIIDEDKLTKTTEDYLDDNFYLIGPGDQLILNLFDLEEGNFNILVLNDGSGIFPLIGRQKLTGLTIEDASKLLKKEYAKELLRPELLLNIGKARPIRVSIVGEVQMPGIYTFSDSKNTNLVGTQIEGPNIGLPTLVDVIQKAGGITVDANIKSVEILRRMPGEKISYKKAIINLEDLVLNGNQEQNLHIFDGDSIKFSKAKELPKDNVEIARSNLSPKTITINIVGQVNSPGKIQVANNTPLIQAVYLAGGPIDWKANKGNVELLRIQKNGSAYRKKFKINLNQALSLESNPPLKNNDIVYVRSNNLNRVGSGFKTITESISPAITTITLFKLLE